ncbi:hypothetical protein H4O20_13895 [Aequorivita sp. 609]|uniref:Lipocalin-like domain-containing protein n=1 Tax=Aequorivita xiaoshiensis TaxID=2874476 RepID=A0A9X1R395_9FLAO|nr:MULTISPECIES: hypothetical protein [Aequorivita]MBB6682537.1 hypothetical protein [Aequorivita sp. 609]MCG2430763.1 hypothetical protein [Aequorivita xiaoshiensis]
MKNLNSILMKSTFILLIFILLVGCSSNKRNLTNKFYGQWAIEDMIYNNNSFKEKLNINFMVFNKENKISLPESEKGKKDTNSKWSIIEKDQTRNMLLIETGNKPFQGLYKVNFIKDKKKKLVGIELISDSTYIKAFKFFQNFDEVERNW